MNSKEIQIRVIELLVKQEEALSQLYKIYAEKFPNYEDFWSKLATDELVHAGWIRALHSKIKEGSLYFDRNRFKEAAIQTTTNYIERQIAKARSQKVPLISALSTALGIENSLLEKKFFEVFEGDLAELKHTLLRLAASTEEHRDRVRDRVQKTLEKNTSPS